MVDVVTVAVTVSDDQYCIQRSSAAAANHIEDDDDNDDDEIRNKINQNIQALHQVGS